MGPEHQRVLVKKLRGMRGRALGGVWARRTRLQCSRGCGWGHSEGAQGRQGGRRGVCAIRTSMLELKARFTLALMLTTCPTLENTERREGTRR